MPLTFRSRYVITIGLFLPNIRQACEIYGGVEKIITLGMEEKPDDCLSFIDMLIYDDGTLYQKVRNQCLTATATSSK